MDIWQVVIIIVCFVGLVYIYVQTIAEKRRNEQLIRKLFACVYQLKDRLLCLSALQDHGQQVVERLPWIKKIDLERIDKSLVKESMALAVLLYLKMEKGFDFTQRYLFNNIALQKEDRTAMQDIIKYACDPEYCNYTVDFYDDEMTQILDVLKALSDPQK